MFLSRNRRANIPERPPISLNPGLLENSPPSIDPSSQAELVSKALLHLEQVQQMVRTLDEVPSGDRPGLLAELEGTADSLRQLYFLDAVY